MRSTVMSRLGRTLDRRRADADSEGGAALISVLIIMILIMGLTVTLASTLINAPRAVYTAERNTKTLNAAQAGLQIMLSQLQNLAGAPEANGSVYGDWSKLPCKDSGTFDGSVDGSTSSYQITVRYYLTDPGAMTDAVRTSSRITCGSLTTTNPYYALIESTGTAASIAGISDSTGIRAVQAVYQFDVAHQNVPSGKIYLNESRNYCLVAASTALNAVMRFQSSSSTACGDTAAALLLNQWVYDTDWEIKLASTLTSVDPLQWRCISGMSKTQDIDAQLQKCKDTTDPSRGPQLWNWGGSYSWQGQNYTTASLIPLVLPSVNSGTFGCLRPTDPSNPLNTTLQFNRSGCSGSLFPEPAVGAAAAGYGTHQLVNFEQFGRCADVTDGAKPSDATFMISYPCKQDASGANSFDWNHKWFYTEPNPGVQSAAPQPIYVYYNNLTTQKYCLKAPSANNGYALFVDCTSSSTAANLQWTRYGVTTDYATSYVFVDNNGRCLDINPTDLYRGWGKLISSTCDGTTLQKWNAEPDGAGAVFGTFKEKNP